MKKVDLNKVSGGNRVRVTFDSEVGIHNIRSHRSENRKNINLNLDGNFGGINILASGDNNEE